MTDSLGPGKLVRHMQNPSYTYDKYLICIGLGPSISSVICKNLSYSVPSYPSSPVFCTISMLYFLLFQVSGHKFGRQPCGEYLHAVYPRWVDSQSAGQVRRSRGSRLPALHKANTGGGRVPPQQQCHSQVRVDYDMIPNTV